MSNPISRPGVEPIERLRDLSLAPAKSSNIAATGHCPETNALVVQFSSGKRYAYPGVTREQFDEMHQAESLGSHFAKHIRGAHKAVEL